MGAEAKAAAEAAEKAAAEALAKAETALQNAKKAREDATDAAANAESWKATTEKASNDAKDAMAQLLEELKKEQDENSASITSEASAQGKHESATSLSETADTSA